MILIKQKLRANKISTKKLKADAQKVLDLLGYPDYDLGIWLTTNQTIRSYNKKFRYKDKPTDILSFPYYPDLKPGEKIIPHSDEEKNLGDLIISLEYVQNDAQEYGESLSERLRMLLVHGICHLLGYDHIKDDEYEVMRKKEASLLKKLNEAIS